MTAREYLLQYRDADRLARRLEREYLKEREMIDAVRSTADIDGLPHGNGIRKPVEDRAVRLADKAAAWKIAQLDALQIRQQIFETINKVKGDASDVLFERYINGKTWREVERAVHWSRYKVYLLHEDGLSQVEKQIQHYTTPM